MRIAFLFNYLMSEHLPFGMTTLGAMVKQRGHACEYFPSEVPYEDLRARLAAFDPGVLAYSTSTNCLKGYLEVNARLRADFPSVRSIFGGPHPTLCPEMIEQQGVDMVCVGEGEFPLVEYLAALDHGAEPSGIANLWIKHPDGAIERNPTRPFIDNLDDLPFPDYSFVERRPILRESRIAYVMAGRGCPFRCSYCINHILCSKATGKYVRLRSVENVLQEIEEIVRRYECVYVNFQDDTFASSLPWLREFAEKFPARIGLPFFCHLTAKLVREETADLLARAGCDVAVIGVETGDEGLRRGALKKVSTDEDILRTARLMRARGIQLVTQNMFGIPGETVHTALKTIELNQRCDVPWANFYFFQPYPMMELTDEAARQGLIPPNYEFPRAFSTSGCRIPLLLPDREALQLIGELAFYLLEHPRRFRATKWIARLCGGRWPLIAWLRHLKAIAGPPRRNYDAFAARHNEALRARARSMPSV